MAAPLRDFELRLLRCSLTPPTTTSPSPPNSNPATTSLIHQLTSEIITLIELGDYIAALSSQSTNLLFKSLNSFEFESADRFYLEIHNSIDSFLEEDDDGCKGLMVMSIGIAAFFAFIQMNITGPCEYTFPVLPFLNKDVVLEWDVWARNQVMNTGADLRGKFSLLQYIVFAKILLMKVKDSFDNQLRSVSWWLSRVLFCQQRILDESVSTLFDSLQVLEAETIKHFGEVENVRRYWGLLLGEEEALSIVAMAHLEAGIVEYNYGRIDNSIKYFGTAEDVCGLELSVTGMCGFRSVHQVDAKSQRVLVTNSSTPVIGKDEMNVGSGEVNGVSDILMTPKLVEENKGDGMSSSIPLTAIQQAIVLSQCLIIEKNSARDELQTWDMAPFIEAVDAQELSYYTIQRFCDILRIRWESTRSRTKERSLLMMEKKVETVYASSPGVVQRIPCLFGVYIPSIPELRKEYGELLIRCGMIGEALKIFEDLELWDNLIHCYCLLEKKAAAVELITKRLSEIPNDPRLWCSLGDVTLIDAHYEKALEVSNNKSARAKRSLARSAYNRGDYKTAKTLWESALAMNSLYPDGWFAFGAAALKDRDIDKALNAFSRAVQFDPDNGEAWNNIACLHMLKKNNKESFIAFKEAIKFKRNNWQIWENFSEVAVNIGNFTQALEAIKMVLDKTNNKRIDVDLMDKILTELESRIFGSSNESKAEENKLVQSRETENLVELLGNVLKQSIRGGLGGDIWGLYARWHKIKGDLTMCSEALLKQVRSYQGADLWKSEERFKKFASASLQLCKVYMDISESTGSRRELNAAEMHLRNTVKQAVDFSKMEEFQGLQSCLEEVRKRLQAV
ncbi:hypothetical protein ACHQM5_030075 [Ranunculus cassubicifolius]